MYLRKLKALPKKLHRVLLRSGILLRSKILLRSRVLRKMCKISAISSDEKLGIGALYFIESMKNISYYCMDISQPIAALLIGLADHRVFFYMICIDSSDSSITVKYSRDSLTIKQSKKTIKLNKEDAYDILKQMSLEKKIDIESTRIKIGKKEFNAVSSVVELNYEQYYTIKKHFIGRLINIYEWPMHAIMLWATYHLKLDRKLLYDAVKRDSKKEIIKLSQKYFTYKAKGKLKQNKVKREVIENPCTTGIVGCETATNVSSGSNDIFLGVNDGAPF